MSEQAAQEPTMEEILASIRRIISEDDAPAEGQAPAAEPAPEAAPAPAPAAPAESPALMDEAPSVQAADEEVLELTEKVEEPVQSIGDIDIAPRAEAAPEPVAAAPEPAPAPTFTAAPTPSFTPSGNGGMTVEDLVRSMLEPQIKAWAEQNLERLVAEIVREKVGGVFK